MEREQELCIALLIIKWVNKSNLEIYHCILGSLKCSQILSSRWNLFSNTHHTPSNTWLQVIFVAEISASNFDMTFQTHLRPKTSYAERDAETDTT